MLKLNDRRNRYGIMNGSFSRFATMDEVKNQFSCSSVMVSKRKEDVSGVPILYVNNNIYLDNNTAHTIVFGQTGSGKTRRIILPTLRSILNAKENAVLLDVKGELYSHTYKIAKDNGYKIKVLNLRNPQLGNTYNPLKYMYSLFLNGEKERAEIKLYQFIKSLTQNYESAKDPYWINTVENLSVGILKLMVDLCIDDVKTFNINTLVSIAAAYANFNSEGELCDFDKLIYDLCVDEDTKEIFPNAALAATQLLSLIRLPSTTRGCVASEFSAVFSKFTCNYSMSEMLCDWSDNTIDIDEIANGKDEPTIIYINTPDENTSFNFIAQFLVAELYEAIVYKASYEQNNCSRRWNFILDEFANGMKISNILNMMTACRSRNIRMLLVAQDMNQLCEVYSEKIAKSIISNAKNIMYTKTNDYSLMEIITDLCGTTYNVGMNKRIPLMDVYDLASLKMGDVLIKSDGLIYCSHLPDISDYIDDEQMPSNDFINIRPSDYSIFRIENFRNKIANKNKMK